MRRRWGLVVLVAGWLAVGAPAFGQTAKDALKHLPEDALGFAIVNNLAEVSRQADAIAKRFKIPVTQTLLEKAKTDLGIDKGLNEKGSLVAVFLPVPDNEKEAVPLVFVPVTDYQTFLKSLNAKADGGLSDVEFPDGGNSVVGKLGSFAVFTEPQYKERLQKFLKNPPKRDVSKVVPVETWLTEADAVAVLTPPGVKEVLRQFQKGFNEGLENADVPPEAQQFMKSFVGGVKNFIKQAEKDVTHLAVSVKADKAGNANFGFRAVFAKGGAFAKAGQNIKGLQGGPLTGLPDVPYVLAFGGPLPEKLMQAGMKLSTKMVAEQAKEQNVSAEQLKKLEKTYLELTEGMRGFSFVLGVPKEKQPLFHSAYGVYKVDDSHAYLMKYDKSLEVIRDILKDTKLPGIPNYASKRTQLNGMPALVLTGDLNLENQDPISEKVVELMFGGKGKMVITMVAVDKHTILTRYAPPEAMKGTLKHYKESEHLAKDKGATRAMKLLPRDTQWALLLSPSGIVGMVSRGIQEAVPQAGFQVPAFPDSPPIGMGLRLSEGGLEWNLVLPVETQEAIGNYVQQVRQLFGAV